METQCARPTPAQTHARMRAPHTSDWLTAQPDLSWRGKVQRKPSVRRAVTRTRPESHGRGPRPVHTGGRSYLASGFFCATAVARPLACATAVAEACAVARTCSTQVRCSLLYSCRTSCSLRHSCAAHTVACATAVARTVACATAVEGAVACAKAVAHTLQLAPQAQL